jgi:hypothetical protein
VSPAPRLRAGRILALAAFASLPLAWLLPSCGTDAVGVKACRQIEAARCEALLSCPASQHGFERAEQVDACKLFYRDDCLHGLASSREPAESEVTGCVAAVKATAACAKAGAATMTDCAGATLVASDVASEAPSEVSPCAVILKKVEKLSDCAFTYEIPDGGPSDADAADTADSTADSASPSDGAAEAGDAATE